MSELDEKFCWLDLTVVGNERITKYYFDRVFRVHGKVTSDENALERLRQGEKELLESGLFDFDESGLGLEVRKVATGRYKAILNIEGKVKRILTAKAEGNVQGRLGADELRCSIEVALRSTLGRGERFSFEQGLNQHGAPTMTWSYYDPFLVPQCLLFGHRSFKISLSKSVEDRRHVQSVSAGQLALCLDLVPKFSEGFNFSSGMILGDSIPTKESQEIEKSKGKMTTSVGILDSVAAHSKVFARISKMFEFSGGHLGGNVEVAVPCGSSKFLKSEIFGLRTWTVGQLVGIGNVNSLTRYLNGVSFSLFGSWGTLFPLAFHRASSLRYPDLVDRFYLGGPNSIRGFQSLGLGPRSLNHEMIGESSPRLSKSQQVSRGDSLGGIGKLAGAICFQLPFPILPKPLPQHLEFLQVMEQARLFFSLSAGWLQSPRFWPTKLEFIPIATLVHEVRVSTSVGISLPLPQFGGELLFTYSVPLKMSNADVIKPWQLGFGVGFAL